MLNWWSDVPSLANMCVCLWVRETENRWRKFTNCLLVNEKYVCVLYDLVLCAQLLLKGGARGKAIQSGG